MLADATLRLASLCSRGRDLGVKHKNCIWFPMRWTCVPPHPGFISSHASSWLDLGASVPSRTFPVSVWMTLTGSSLIWLLSSIGCTTKRRRVSFKLHLKTYLAVTINIPWPAFWSLFISFSFSFHCVFIAPSFKVYCTLSFKRKIDIRSFYMLLLLHCSGSQIPPFLQLCCNDWCIKTQKINKINFPTSLLPAAHL